MSYYSRRRRARAPLSDETIETIAEYLAQSQWETSARSEALRRCLTKLKTREFDLIQRRYHAEQTLLRLNQWQFVASTLDGATLRPYRNGREVGSAPCPGLSTFAPSALGIGVKLDRAGAQPERNTPGFWHGLIDELAVFHYALTPDRIEKLFQHTRDLPSVP